MQKNIGPLSNVKALWDHDLGGYPERIRLAMEDGHIVTYLLDVQQPAPNVIPEYQPKHLKKTGDAATSTGPRANLSNNYSNTEKGNKQ